MGHRVSGVVAALLLCALALAQDAPPQVALRTSSHLVQISVIATDWRGRPIANLKREDFRLFDSGKQRAIQLFSVDRSEPAAIPPARSSAQVFTNSSTERSGPTGVTVILLDGLNTSWVDQSSATRGVIQYLKRIRPGDHIALYVVGVTGFHVLHDFTTDSADLLAALASWKGDIPPAPTVDQLWTVLAGNDMGSLANQTSRPYIYGSDMSGSASTLAVFATLAERLGGIPGRKNLIWISDGFSTVSFGNAGLAALPGPAHRTTLLPPPASGGASNAVFDTLDGSGTINDVFERVVKMLAGANVGVYPIAAYGLSTTGPPGGSEQVMLSMAKHTGGKAFVEANDIPGSIDRAEADSRVTYTLGFYPETVNFDGKFHRLKVKLVKRHGVSLRYRGGYFDSNSRPSELGQRRQNLEDAAASPLDASAIPLTARMVRGWSPGHYTLRLTIGTSGMGILPTSEMWDGKADVFVVQRDKRGRPYSPVHDTIYMHLKPASFKRLEKTGISYTLDILPNPKMNVIRVVVRDASSGDIGSLTIPAAALR